MVYRKHSKRKRNKRIVSLLVILALVGGVIYLLAQFSTPAVSDSQKLAYLTIQSTDPVEGSSSAPVTIFEYGEFQCPSCGAWFKTQEPSIVQNLIDTGKAKLVWRDFDYYGPDSFQASYAARAAGEQGKFWQYYNILFSNQGTVNSGWANKTNLVGFAMQLGLDMTRFNQDFNSGNYTSIVADNKSVGQKLGVSGTPTFFVVGATGHIITIVGGQPYSVFQQAVNSV
jgi:protein-disulfide isomerase